MLLQQQAPAGLTRVKSFTLQIKRSFIDRRSSANRRQTHSLDYFLAGGIERRRIWHERRQQKEERRRGWLRVNEWSSMYVGEYAD